MLGTFLVELEFSITVVTIVFVPRVELEPNIKLELKSNIFSGANLEHCSAQFGSITLRLRLVRGLSNVTRLLLLLALKLASQSAQKLTSFDKKVISHFAFESLFTYTRVLFFILSYQAYLVFLLINTLSTSQLSNLGFYNNHKDLVPITTSGHSA